MINLNISFLNNHTTEENKKNSNIQEQKWKKSKQNL